MGQRSYEAPVRSPRAEVQSVGPKEKRGRLFTTKHLQDQRGRRERKRTGWRPSQRDLRGRQGVGTQGRKGRTEGQQRRMGKKNHSTRAKELQGRFHGSREGV